MEQLASQHRLCSVTGDFQAAHKNTYLTDCIKPLV